MRGLIASVGILAHQPSDDVTHHRRHFGCDDIGPRRARGEVRLHVVERRAALKGQAAGEQLEEQHPQGIEIGALVDLAIHAPGLFGCHVGRRAFESHAGSGMGSAARQPEVDQAQAFRGARHEHVGRLDVAVHHAMPVHIAHDARELHGEAERGLDIELVDIDAEVGLAERFEDEHGLGAVALDAERAAQAGDIGQIGEDVVLDEEPAGELGVGDLEDHALAIGRDGRDERARRRRAHDLFSDIAGQQAPTPPQALG